VVPGSHKHDRADIVKMVEESGSERLVNAVPIICGPGDVVINNRQVVHGSFANTGFETRVTVNFGFHKRSSVLNVKGAGIHAEAKIMDSEYINKRSEVIALAINARKKRFPNETPFNYIPLSDNLNAFDWNESSMAELKDYNLMDLSI
jgi:ectoine hydroxylase-related dioxygenase (phytanoyl-CoA dioxygenase family)